MNSQPNASHIDHHLHANFDHVLASLEHLRVTRRERIKRLEREREDLEIQRAALVRELQKHADIQDVWSQSLEGYEDKSHPVESHVDRARHHFRGMVTGTVAAVVLGVYFAVNTTMADSVLLLFLGSVVVAIGLGMFMYRRPGVYHKRHHHLLQRAATVEDHLADEHVDLPSTEHRIEEHEEAHHGGHPVHGHTEEHHERHHEAVSH